MKRTLSASLGTFLALLILILISSCEVDHTYDTQITVVDASGQLMSGFTVTTNVDVNLEHQVYREAVSDVMGQVFFSYDNLAILKVQASSNGYYGEALLVLEEDITVPITVVVYN